MALTTKRSPSAVLIGVEYSSISSAITPLASRIEQEPGHAESLLWLRTRRPPCLEPSLHPFQFLVITVHRVPWCPSAVIRVGVTDHARGDAELPDRDVHLLGLLDRHTGVRLSV